MKKSIPTKTNDGFKVYVVRTNDGKPMKDVHGKTVKIWLKAA